VAGSVPGTATIDFVAGPASASLSTLTASPPSTLAGGATGSTVTVTLRDSAGNLAVGRSVILSASGSSTAVAVAIPDALSGCATQAPSGTTDCNGQAAFTVTDPAIETATYTARDVTDSVSITETVSVAFTAAPSVGSTTATASPQSVAADGTSQATVTVTLRDAAGQPIPGKQLCLTQATGTVAGAGPCPAAGAGPSTVIAAVIPSATSGCPVAVAGTTNCQGQATFDVSATVAGQVTYGVVDTTDYPGGVPLGPAATVTFTPVPTEAGQSTVVASPTVAIAGDAGSSGAVTLVVTLRDAAGAPISGHPVNLSAQAGAHAVVTPESSGGTCATSPPDGTTNCDGQATFTVTDPTSETVVLRATDTSTGIMVDQTATVSFIPNEQTASTAVASSPTATADGGATPSGIDVVTVTLDPGIPLVGDLVPDRADRCPGDCRTAGDPHRYLGMRHRTTPRRVRLHGPRLVCRVRHHRRGGDLHRRRYHYPHQDRPDGHRHLPAAGCGDHRREPIYGTVDWRHGRHRAGHRPLHPWRDQHGHRRRRCRQRRVVHANLLHCRGSAI
jgi:adhesin/invasin